jgi:hypothetical protein
MGIVVCTNITILLLISKELLIMDDQTRAIIIGALVAIIPIFLTQLFTWLSARAERRETYAMEKRRYRRQMEEKSAEIISDALSRTAKRIFAFRIQYAGLDQEEAIARMKRDVMSDLGTGAVAAGSMSTEVYQTYLKLQTDSLELAKIIENMRSSGGELSDEDNKTFERVVFSMLTDMGQCQRMVHEYLSEATWEK